MMNDQVRKAFESVCVPNFGFKENGIDRRLDNGQYLNNVIEDHWQTFQEGWECAIEFGKTK